MSNSYAFRPSALEKEKIYTLEEEHFTITQNEKVDTVKYAEIKSVRLYYDPTRFAFNKYQCDITLNNGANTLIKSVHYVKPTVFEDRAEAYTQFIKSFHERLTGYNQIAFMSGNKAGCFSLNLIITVLSVVILAWAVSFFGISSGAVTVLRIIIFVSLLFWAFKYLKKNKPKTYNPANIPESVLPKPNGARQYD